MESEIVVTQNVFLYQKEYHIIMEIQQIALLMQTHRLYFQIQVLGLPLNKVMQLLLLV